MRIKQIPDGLTNTYLIGEKSVQPKCYQYSDPNSGQCPADNGTVYEGHDTDVIRWANSSTIPTVAVNAGANDITPLKDKNALDASGNPDDNWGRYNFGSQHSTGCFFVMCDGSVQSISYLVDQRVHWKLANRLDGADVQIP